MGLSSFPQPDVPSLLQAITTTGEALSQHEPGAREKLLKLSYSLSAALETTGETIQRIGWAEPARFAGARLAVDLKLFDQLAESADITLSAAQLASRTGAEVPLIARTMKHLSAMNIVAERSADNYASTPLSNALTIPKYRDGISYCFDVAGPSFFRLPAYLEETGYRNPYKVSDGPFQFAHNTRVPFWVFLDERPAQLERFNNYMSGYRQGRRSWMDADFYPVVERLGRNFHRQKDAVLLVDVGGGIGHDLEEFRTKHPHIHGRLILQDRPEVISQITRLLPGIEPTMHDFFTLQPIKGAKAYYLHSVLHDWDDKAARKILSQLMPALKKNYSKVLIDEIVVPDSGAGWSTTSADYLMMALGAVRERTEREWYDLLDSVGLKIVKIWTCEQGTESLIEAELEEYSISHL